MSNTESTKTKYEKEMKLFEEMGKKHFMAGAAKAEAELQANKLREIIKVLKEELPLGMNHGEVLSSIVRIQL